MFGSPMMVLPFETKAHTEHAYTHTHTSHSNGPLRAFSKIPRSVDQEHLVIEVPTPHAKHSRTHRHTLTH